MDSPTPEFFEKLKQLHYVSLELSRHDNILDLCRVAIERGRAELGFDRVGIFLISEDGERFLGTSGVGADGLVRDERANSGRVVDDPFIMEALQSRGQVIIRRDVPLLDRGVVFGRGWNTLTTLWDGHKIIGCLAADNLLTQAPLTPLTLELINVYGVTLGHLISRKRVENALEESEGNTRRFQVMLRRLHEVTIELSALHTLDDLFQQAIIRGRADLGFDRLGLFLIDEATDELVGTFGTDDLGNLRDERHFRAKITDDPKVSEAVQSKQRMKYWLDTPLRDMWQSVGVGWNAMAMLWDEDRCIGWLATDNLLRKEHFDPYLVELLSLYGVTLGHLINRQRAEQARLELAVEREKLELLRTFIANVTHDLKTPLAVIKTSAYLLNLVPEMENHQSRLAVIEHQTNQLEHLIQNLLMMSRLDYLPQLDIQPIDVNQLVKKLMMHMQPSFERHELEIQLDLDAGALPIEAAETELYRAFMNLVENAIHYTPSGGKIRVQTRQSPDTLTIEVADTGVGIGDTELPYIFERFYRTEDAQEKVKSGTGLGLAIVKRVVELHYGEIVVTSELGKGTTFQIVLPLARQASAELV